MLGQNYFIFNTFITTRCTIFFITSGDSVCPVDVQYLTILNKCFILFFVDHPTVSGMSDMDYPLQGPGLLSVPNLPEISSIRRVPLPPELVEQFGRILFVFNSLKNFFNDILITFLINVLYISSIMGII